MEIKQFKYLVAAAENKSLNKAAEKMYISQSNISKSLRKLEEDLNIKILERTTRGVYLTPVGEQIYEQAKLLLNTLDHIEEIASNAAHDVLRIACYPSQMISRKLVDYYKDHVKEDIHIEFLVGKTYEVFRNISTFKADLGFLLYPSEQVQRFNRLLAQNNLKGNVLKECDVRLYIGPNNPMYDREIVTLDELKGLQFVQESVDNFSIIDQLGALTDGKLSVNDIEHVVHTNAGQTIINLVEETSLCNLGLDINPSVKQTGKMKKIRISGCDGLISLCRVTRIDHKLNGFEEEFVRYVESIYSE